ncbi:Protein of uncharacterised function (DUF2975) [Legionella israelensis]|uniref:DUF2975 domain-containing protein n=2 Tax=Legionella israelensis TaxID=454 RepID=A0A0W0W5N3_9GAMM|nr:hypothetical protein Lisr_0992 [Legionella israelensis]QBS10527.1 DUF2975 domain-containing protein [Legionella israelensis]SCY44543.1 Protein of unknown function [Legionella israelensis DSM 19235]STX57462.1 Protein of uncharacterised function (DUF2975) [Legionella israelensis]
MRKIKTASRILHLIFMSLCWLLPIVTAFFTFFHIDTMIHYGMFDQIISSSKIHSTDYSLIHKAIIFTIQLLPLSITIFICHRLAKLFNLYEHGSLFELDNIKIIKQISILMIIGEFIQIIYQPLITAALSFNNPAGQRFASITLGSTNLTTLITAFIILIASWMVKEAYELKNDAQLTI